MDFCSFVFYFAQFLLLLWTFLSISSEAQGEKDTLDPRVLRLGACVVDALLAKAINDVIDKIPLPDGVIIAGGRALVVTIQRNKANAFLRTVGRM